MEDDMQITLDGDRIALDGLKAFAPGRNGFIEYADGTRIHGDVIVRTVETISAADVGTLDTREITSLGVQVVEEVKTKEGQ